MNKKVFIENRKKIADLLPNNSIFILYSLAVDPEDFVVNKNFYFTTGCDEEHDIFVMYKIKDKAYSTMFIREYDAFYEKWFGTTFTKKEVQENTGIMNVKYLSEYDDFISRYLSVLDNVFLDLNREDIKTNPTFEENFAGTLRMKYPAVSIYDAKELLTRARSEKQDEEVEQIKIAAEITNKGLQEILKHIHGGIYEYQLESYFDGSIKYNGANGFSFPTIAASGANGVCLHYSENKDLLKDGDLILFDLGARYNHYCADISRTYPINGKFSPRQKQIYNIVLHAQDLVAEAAKPGITTRQLNQIVVDYYAKELKKIGLINSPEEVDKYYYHGVSHHLGLDCHDYCDYGPLREGAVISNEPGLYIAEENIGIRIEDDIRVTKNGGEYLSSQIIKKPEEIEEFIAKNNIFINK